MHLPCPHRDQCGHLPMVNTSGIGIGLKKSFFLPWVAALGYFTTARTIQHNPRWDLVWGSGVLVGWCAWRDPIYPHSCLCEVNISLFYTLTGLPQAQATKTNQEPVPLKLWAAVNKRNTALELNGIRIHSEDKHEWPRPRSTGSGCPEYYSPMW